jgi:TetR/AcrR family transcriptional regulator, regulator of mycofactocin system
MAPRDEKKASLVLWIDVAAEEGGEPRVDRLTSRVMTIPHGASLLGRPRATSHAEIERAAFRLFALRGFDGTTLDAIAGEVGISRRTLLRYFDSKNDIPWGRFAETLDGFRATLAAMPADQPLYEAVHAAVLAFNRFDLDAHPSHRERMQLILTTPTLQAHSVLRYGEWRRVIAEYVARRLDLRPDDLLPGTVGQVSLALTLSAYTHWLDHPDLALHELLDMAMGGLRNYLGSS